MRLTRYLIPFIIFLLLVIIFWRGFYQDPRLVPSPLIGKSVPEFNAESLKSDSTHLSQQLFLNHVSLLVVWASWCSTCQAEQPMLMDIARTKVVPMYGLNYKDERAAAEKFLQRAGNPYGETIYDPQGILGINLGVYGTPETFLIDQKGIIRYKYVGAISHEEWQTDLLPRIKQLQAQKA